MLLKVGEILVGPINDGDNRVVVLPEDRVRWIFCEEFPNLSGTVSYTSASEFVQIFRFKPIKHAQIDQEIEEIFK